ncbi:nuclear pore membrane glycoprotein 210-like [Drosophila eugracilis]|nr:nuclear pore membrane glycoprotein 210-like [Drosophila eugracilis]
MVLGTLQNIKIFWKVSQPQAVEILDIFTATEVEYQSEDLILRRVRALNPGKVIKLPPTSLKLIALHLVATNIRDST